MLHQHIYAFLPRVEDSRKVQTAGHLTSSRAHPYLTACSHYSVSHCSLKVTHISLCFTLLSFSFQLYDSIYTWKKVRSMQDVNGRRTHCSLYANWSNSWKVTSHYLLLSPTRQRAVDNSFLQLLLPNMQFEITMQADSMDSLKQHKKKRSESMQ